MEIIAEMQERLLGQTLFPALKSLKFEHNYHESSENQLSPIIQQFCTSDIFGNPWKLSFHCITISPATLIDLLKKSNVEELSIWHHYKVFPLPPPSSLYFHNLCQLRLFLPTPGLYITFLNALNQVASLETITLDGLYMAPDPDELYQLLSTLSKTCNPLSLTDLCISMGPDWENNNEEWVEELQCIELEQLGPLDCFHNLERLRISYVCMVHNMDVELITRFLAKGFPNLESLGIGSLHRGAFYTPDEEWEDWVGVHRRLQEITGKDILAIKDRYQISQE